MWDRAASPPRARGAARRRRHVGGGTHVGHLADELLSLLDAQRLHLRVLAVLQRQADKHAAVRVELLVEASFECVVGEAEGVVVVGKHVVRPAEDVARELAAIRGQHTGQARKCGLRGAAALRGRTRKG